MNKCVFCTVMLAGCHTSIGLHGHLIETQNTNRISKQIFGTMLRNKNTSRAEYRRASDMVASALAHEAFERIATKTIQIETPLAPLDGIQLGAPVVLLPVIRSGLPLLSTFLQYFQDARVGFVGLARDEQTAIAHWYYEKVPQLNGDEYIIILEPMLATGGTAVQVLNKVKELGAREDHIIFVSVICAVEGVERVNKLFPDVIILTVAVDNDLNSHKFIVPGLGDFGDRYYGTD